MPPPTQAQQTFGTGPAGAINPNTRGRGLTPPYLNPEQMANGITNRGPGLAQMWGQAYPQGTAAAVAQQQQPPGAATTVGGAPDAKPSATPTYASALQSQAPGMFNGNPTQGNSAIFQPTGSQPNSGAPKPMAAPSDGSVPDMGGGPQHVAALRQQHQNAMQAAQPPAPAPQPAPPPVPPPAPPAPPPGGGMQILGAQEMAPQSQEPVAMSQEQAPQANEPVPAPAGAQSWTLPNGQAYTGQTYQLGNGPNKYDAPEPANFANWNQQQKDTWKAQHLLSPASQSSGTGNTGNTGQTNQNNAPPYDPNLANQSYQTLKQFLGTLGDFNQQNMPAPTNLNLNLPSNFNIASIGQATLADGTPNPNYVADPRIRDLLGRVGNWAYDYQAYSSMPGNERKALELSGQINQALQGLSQVYGVNWNPASLYSGQQAPAPGEYQTPAPNYGVFSPAITRAFNLNDPDPKNRDYAGAYEAMGTEASTAANDANRVIGSDYLRQFQTGVQNDPNYARAQSIADGLGDYSSTDAEFQMLKNQRASQYAQAGEQSTSQISELAAARGMDPLAYAGLQREANVGNQQSLADALGGMDIERFQERRGNQLQNMEALQALSRQRQSQQSTASMALANYYGGSNNVSPYTGLGDAAANSYARALALNGGGGMDNSAIYGQLAGTAATVAASALI